MIPHDHVGEEPAAVFRISELVNGEWYWVREQGGDWFPAKWSADYGDGRFTNDDTWEDLRDEIVEWVHIPRPDLG